LSDTEDGADDIGFITIDNIGAGASILKNTNGSEVNGKEITRWLLGDVYTQLITYIRERISAGDPSLGLLTTSNRTDRQCFTPVPNFDPVGKYLSAPAALRNSFYVMAGKRPPGPFPSHHIKES
jgi:hypothetical protein